MVTDLHGVTGQDIVDHLITPVDHQSGARKGRARAKKGNRYLAGISGETAVAAGPKCSAATEKASAMVMASRTQLGAGVLQPLQCLSRRTPSPDPLGYPRLPR